MASPCRAGAGVIRRVQGIPFPHGVRRCADPGASHPSAAAAASGDPGASVVSPLLPHMAGVGGLIRAHSGRPIPPRRAVLVVVILARSWRPFHHGAGAGDWKEGGVPAYGGIAYCQRSILERSFIDQ